MAKSKDLFDDSSMTFGEHLEVLRVHLIRALVGLAVAVIGCLFIGESILGEVRAPIDSALKRYGVLKDEGVDHSEGYGFTEAWEHVQAWWSGEAVAEAEPKEQEAVAHPEDDQQQGAIRVQVRPSSLAKALTQLDPQRYPPPGDELKDDPISLTIWAPEFARFLKTSDKIEQPITLTVQEAFMTYLKVSFVAGLIVASPWVFYQLWLFVAAGLYPHERRYVYIYMPITLGLFLGGALFCFYIVFPFVLDFLLSFNAVISVTPQIRLSEWISFAIMLPLMFGLSFELPVVMLFLERISIFQVTDYREKRRMAILVIAILAMFLTPAEPVSMMAMMIPLVVLYELGILLCEYRPARSPFEEAEAA